MQFSVVTKMLGRFEHFKINSAQLLAKTHSNHGEHTLASHATVRLS